MTCSYKTFCNFLLCMVRYIFFGIKVISRFIGLIYENIAKMANKNFKVPNHLKQTYQTRSKETYQSDRNIAMPQLNSCVRPDLCSDSDSHLGHIIIFVNVLHLL